MGIKEDFEEYKEMEKNWVEGECNCGLAKRLTGDGCQYCRPQEYIDRLVEQIGEMEKTIEKDIDPLIERIGELEGIVKKKQDRISKLAYHLGEIHGKCVAIHKELVVDA